MGIKEILTIVGDAVNSALDANLDPKKDKKKHNAIAASVNAALAAGVPDELAMSVVSVYPDLDAAESALIKRAVDNPAGDMTVIRGNRQNQVVDHRLRAQQLIGNVKEGRNYVSGIVRNVR
tara:strand:- start:164 stop:526 length:363 start_codon:yes stop_codon:yes gene_type:complete